MFSPYLSCLKWDPSQFTQVPHGHWDQIANQRAFMERLAKTLNITNHDGWYKISNALIRKHGGAGLLHKYNGSAIKLLEAVYPEYPHIYVIVHLLYITGTK